MKMALIRRICITYLDSANRFIALLAEGLKRLDHEVKFLATASNVWRKKLEE